MPMTIEILNDSVLNYAKRQLLSSLQLPSSGEQNVEFIRQVVDRIERRELSDIPSLFAALGINAQVKPEISDRVANVIYAFLRQCLTDQDKLCHTYLMYAVQERVDTLSQVMAVYELLQPTDLYDALVLMDKKGVNPHEFAFKNKPELACLLLPLSDRLTEADQIRFLAQNKAAICHLAFEKTAETGEALLQRLQHLAEDHPAEVRQITETESDQARLLLATAIYHQSAMTMGLLTLIYGLENKLNQPLISHLFKASRLRLLDTAIHHHPDMVDPLLSYFDHLGETDRQKLLAHRDGLCPLSVAVLNQPALIMPVLQRVIELRQHAGHSLLLDVIRQVFLQQEVPSRDRWLFIKPVIEALISLEERQSVILTRTFENTVLSLLENLNFTQPGLLDLLSPLINKIMEKAWLKTEYGPRLMRNFQGNYPVLLPAMQALDAESRQTHLPRLISGILEAGNTGVSAVFAASLDSQQQKHFNNILRLSLSRLLWAALFERKAHSIKSFLDEFKRFSQEDQRDIMLRQDLNVTRSGASLFEQIAVADDKVSVNQKLLCQLLVTVRKSNQGLFNELCELVEKNSKYSVGEFLNKYKLEPMQQYSQASSSESGTEEQPDTVVEVPEPPLPSHVAGTASAPSRWFAGGMSLFNKLPPVATALSALKEATSNPSQSI
ncbi:hypothetical protein [Legionella sp. CNM-4043-24]|uniref:hypothetical protein n=1 Tax=Legionella sp. CNM-4043-24 TaxID=3421646 RepID=UPI00403B066C